MSLALELGTKPHGLEIKTYGLPGSLPDISLGDYEISMEDFLIAAHYVLTNVNLEPNDPRLHFVKCIQAMHEVPGWGEKGKRLDSQLPPVILRQPSIPPERKA